MWTVLRKVASSCSQADVEQLAGVSGEDARAFLEDLVRAGYLARRKGEYALCRDTGPLPPGALEVRALEDGNTGAVCMISEAPVDALRKLQNRSSRDECTRLVVLSLDGRRRFGLDYAMSATGLDRRKTLRVLNRLERDGFLKLLDERKEPNAYREFGPNRRNPLYQVVKDPALHPTRQKKTATARDVLWRTIRRMRRFTFQGLAESSGCTPASAQGFVQLLARDGWVRQDGLEGRRKVFVIVSDPGPQRPVTFEPKDGGRDERDEQKNG
jgi:hypothetical protein